MKQPLACSGGRGRFALPLLPVRPIDGKDGIKRRRKTKNFTAATYCTGLDFF